MRLIIFLTGPKPNVIKGTKAIIKVQEKSKVVDNTKWHAEIINEAPDSIILEVI